MVMLYKYGLLAVCIVILIEYACFPVSSEIVLPFSGVVAHMSDIDIRVLIFLSVVCGLIGSSICYFIGRILGEKSIRWITKRIPKSKNALVKSEEFFNTYGNFSVMIARVIPLCRTYISFLAGAFKQSYISFLLCSAAGITVWNTVLISLGYMLGDKWNIVEQYYNQYKLYVLILIVCVAFLLYKRRRG